VFSAHQSAQVSSPSPRHCSRGKKPGHVPCIISKHAPLLDFLKSLFAR